MQQLTAGMGKNPDDLARRINTIERFLGGYQVQRLATESGKFDVLALPAGKPLEGNNAWQGVLGRNEITINNAILYPTIYDNPIAIGNAEVKLAVSNGMLIWLDISFNTDMSVDTANITTGYSWPKLIEFNGIHQTKARVRIGHIVANEWKPLLCTPLCLFLMVANGKAALYPLAFC